jgi:hypothetical protein
MDKHVIKNWLINKKPKVCSVIVAYYFERLTMLQTALFIEWLSQELDVPQTMINKSSVSSALRRYRKRMQIRIGVGQLGQQVMTIKDPFNSKIPQKLVFK